MRVGCTKSFLGDDAAVLAPGRPPVQLIQDHKLFMADQLQAARNAAKQANYRAYRADFLNLPS